MEWIKVILIMKGDNRMEYFTAITHQKKEKIKNQKPKKLFDVNI